MVEVWAVPMGIGDFVLRAGADQEMLLTLRVGRERAVEIVVIKGEAALESAGEVRKLFLPRPPFAQRTDKREVVIRRDFLQQQIGQRRGRFPDGKTGMPSPLNHRR